MASPLAALVRRLAAVPTGLQAMGYMLASAMTISGMNGVVIHLTASMHVFEIAFIRQVIGAVFMTLAFGRRGFRLLHTRRLPMHVLRAALNVVAMVCFFLGLASEAMATVVSLSLSVPLLASLAAVVFLGEPMRARRWIALGLGLVGSLAIIRPGVQPVSFGVVMVLVSNVVWAFGLVTIKSLTRTDSSVTITFYAALLQTPMALCFAAFVWTWPSAEQLLWLAVIGVFGTLAQLSLSHAFRLADATLVLPVDFTKVIWAGLIGYLAFGQVPQPWVWVGAVIVFCGVLYNALQERGVP
jgi:drug/metabolite transporter (DMT)-like permease